MVRIALIGILFCAGCFLAFAHGAPKAQSSSMPPPLPGNARPLVSGEFLSGTLWEKPVTHLPGSNTGYSPAAGCRVDVYDNFIVVTDAEGNAELSLHGSYTKLRFKPQR